MKHILFALALILSTQAAMAAETSQEDLAGGKPTDHCSTASGACRTGIIKK